MSIHGEKKSLSLVVTVYNQPMAFEFILAALQRQTMKDFEVIVADDGSGSEIEEIVHKAQGKTNFSISHVWQADEGFRKNVILNKAIEKAETDYMVFIDGDCIPHCQFLLDHWKERQPNGVLCGRRVNFSKKISESLKLEDISSGRFEKISLKVLIDGLLARSSNLEDGIRIENSLIQRIIRFRKGRIFGCNFSVERRLLEEINGFNEDYQGPGLGEDSDIAFRLELLGARLIPLRYMALLYHLYHPQTIVGGENKRIYERMVSDREVICLNGLRKLESVQSAAI